MKRSKPGSDRRRQRHANSTAESSARREGPSQLRVIGGRLRGRPIQYAGDPRVRPMKDRTREAIFNLLGPSVKGCVAIDLFSGTGAMGIEGISRGAEEAILIEQHIPTYRIIRDTVTSLSIADQVTLVQANAFHWLRTSESLPEGRPWLVFCCPPYAFYEERTAELREMLAQFRQTAPAGSTLVAEAEIPFDFASLDWHDADVRNYPPATVAILRL